MDDPNKAVDRKPVKQRKPRLEPNVAFIGGNRTPTSTVRYNWDGVTLTVGRSRGIILISLFWSVVWGPLLLYLALVVSHPLTTKWSFFGVAFTVPFLATGLISTYLLAGLLFSQNNVRIDFFRGSVAFRRRFYRGWCEELKLAEVDSFYLCDTFARTDMYLGADGTTALVRPRLGDKPDQSSDAWYQQAWCMQMKFKSGREIRIFQTTNKKIAMEICDISNKQLRNSSASAIP